MKRRKDRPHPLPRPHVGRDGWAVSYRRATAQDVTVYGACDALLILTPPAGPRRVVRCWRAGPAGTLPHDFDVRN